jgi:hypothetical protein
MPLYRFTDSRPCQVFCEARRRETKVLVPVLVVWSFLTAAGGVMGNALPKLDAGFATKSVFNDDLNFGRDPFFPESNRRRVVPVPILVPVLPKPQPIEEEDHRFTLKGISTYKDERWALINRYTFAPGEEMDVKVEGRKLRVRCVEVRERSVVISVGGVSKELFLRPDI